MAYWKAYKGIRGAVKAHEAKAHGKAGRRDLDSSEVEAGLREYETDRELGRLRRELALAEIDAVHRGPGRLGLEPRRRARALRRRLARMAG